MKRVLLRPLLFSLVIFALPLSGYIYDVQVMNRWDPYLKKYQYIVGLCDYHDRRHPENKIQRAQLESYLAQANKKDLRVIVEDLSCKGENCQQAFCSDYAINTRGGILGGLSGYCAHQGVSVANVEYRYCRVAAIGPMLRQANAPLQEFKAIHEVTVNTLVDEIEQEIKTVQGFINADTDGRHKPLHRWYTHAIEEIQTGLGRLKLDRHQELTLADYLNLHSYAERRMPLLNELLTFDSILLDLKLVHTITRMHDKPMILVIAGGTHINRMNDALKTIGYKEVQASSISFKKEHDLSQCLGANIVEGSFCVKPLPINIIPTLEKYITNKAAKS